ncbi:MAG TPA: Ig-like domain-containing protein, partial [Gemmatimonadales bacterium]|nr:Ig-like domain-containing protein [Gemmatimonadales bacterium]
IRVPEGTALTLRAAGSDARGNRIDPTGVAWNAGDAAVATIDSAGALRAVAPGTTTVTVAAGGLAAERRVEVVPVPTSITLTAGSDQRAAAGQRLPGAVAIQVVSRSGRPVPNVTVRFDASASVGRVEPDTATTDARGVAESRWTLGPFPGRQRLAVEVPGIDSALVVTAEADPTPKNTHVALVTDSLVGEVGIALAAPVTVRVTDSAGLALADVPVAWTALGGGAFSLADTRTDSLGEARAHWRLGTKAGRQQAKLQVGNPRTLPPFAFSATAVPGAVASLVVVSGDAQRATVGTALAHAIVVRVADSLGNPVGGVPVRIKAQTGKADSVVTTGKDGVASVRWTLGTAAGPVRLVARLESPADSAVVTVTAQPGAPKTIYFAAAPASGTAGRTLPRMVQVIIRDRYGNPVPKVPVRFSVAAGKTTPVQVTTDVSGRASTAWTLGPKRGKHTLTAAVKAPALRATHTVEAAPAKKN